MSRILIVGGYGGFGGRLARRLAAGGHDVLVGGRSVDRAAAFCAASGVGTPVEIDRVRDAAAVIAREAPDIVIDAAGPFQGSGYDLPRACIAAGVDYLDLADGRDFVAGIAALDAAAKAANVAVIAGASSVPALSHAVIAELAKGLDGVTAIDMAISASSRASAGDSVAAAILGGVGQPLRLWAGRRWTRHHGWQSLRRLRFDLPSGKSLGRRTGALADVPDLQLLPGRIDGVSAVAFRAGTESTAANVGLWLAGGLVRAGVVRSIAGAKGLLVPLHRLTSLWGSDRSGMGVRLFGHVGEGRVERRWTLIAERGDGPEIPALAAAILVDRLAAGDIAPGARDAGGLLTLGDFEPAFASLAIEHATIEIAQPGPLYQRVMGSDFAKLAPAVRSIHDVLRDHGAAGRATVERGAGAIAALIAAIMRFPPSGEHDVHVHFEECDGIERWTRDFGGHRFHSRLRAGRAGEIVESFGPLRFRFRLYEDQGGLAMDLRGWALGPLPLPKFLAPRSPAREWEADGRFHFDVPIDLPLVGRVIRYRGWLQA